MLSFAITAELSEKNDYTSNISMMEIGSAFGLMAGPLLVSIVYNYIGYTLTYFIVFLLSFILVLLVRHYFINNALINKVENVDKNCNDDAYRDLKYSNSVNIEVKYGNLHRIHAFENSIRKRSLHSHRNQKPKENIDCAEKYDNIFIEIGSISSLRYEEYLSIGSSKNKNSRSFYSLFLNVKMLFIVLIVMTDMICQTFFYPVFTYHFKTAFGLDVSESSFLFSLSFLVYTAGLRLVIYVIKMTSTKYTICLGVFLNSVVVLFFAPADFLPNNIISPCIGLILLNLTAGFACVGSIFEFSDTLEHELKHSEQEADDRASGVYILTANLGELFGPLMGGYFTTVVDFKFTCFLVGLINISASLIYFTFNFTDIYKSLLIQESETHDNTINDKDNLIYQENIKDKVNSDIYNSG
jgi:MFS family permease